MPALDLFKRAHDRANAAVLRHLANARATWQGGAEFGVIFDIDGEEVFSDAVTAVRHSVSLCVANASGIAEGSTELAINGQSCRVTGAVVPDASGWATFPIALTEASHAVP